MATQPPITGTPSRAPFSHSPRPIAAQALSSALDRMIAVQMAAYPDHWTDAEKREVAEQHLFGREVRRG